MASQSLGLGVQPAFVHMSKTRLICSGRYPSTTRTRALLPGKSSICLGGAVGSRAWSSLSPLRLQLRRNERQGTRGERLVATAFLGSSKGEPLVISLNFYEILHVSRGANREAIYRSYERMISNPPNVGFTEKALHARKIVLEGALETLGTSSIRKEYDERLAIGAVDETIPPKYVSGLLMLLHEAGKYDEVIASGTDWLRSSPRHGSSKDVATVVGCSYITRVTEMIDERKSLPDAKSDLVKAKVLLEKYGGSVQVLDIVEKTLQELGPRLALDLISSSDPATRHEGITLLPMALEEMKKESASDRRSHQTWISYLDRVRQILSAEELIELFNVSEKLFTDARELYYVSVAHIAAGVTNGDPSLIRTAKDLLLKAEKIAKKSDVDQEFSMAGIKSRKVVEEQQRRNMGLCCAELLLGDSGKAAEVLGLRTDPVTCDRQIYTFIKSNSRGSDTLLPGLCVLVERWINEVALSSFYRNPISFSLNYWFEDPKIVNYIEKLGQSNSVFSATMGVIHGLFSPFMGFFTSETKDVVKNSDEKEEEQEQEEQDYEIDNEPANAQEEYLGQLPSNGEGAKPEVIESRYMPPEEVSQVYTDPVAPTVKDAIPKQESERPEYEPFYAPKPSTKGPLTSSIDNDLHENENLYLKGMDLDKMKIFDDDGSRPVDASIIAPLGGEETWIRSAYEARRVRWGRVTATGLLLLAAISAPLGRLGGHSILSRYVHPAARIGFGSSTSLMTKGQAHSIIKRWQRVKADALGKSYNVENLATVLGGSLAEEWKARAMDLKQRGLHYVHNKHDCKVRSVQLIPSGNHIVVADIQENIVVHKNDGSRPQTFASSYKVTYEIANTSSGWKVMSATIQK